MRCFNCYGLNFENKRVEHSTRVGSHEVRSHLLAVPVCRTCGEYTMASETLEKSELEAALVALVDAPAVSAEMARFARKALGLTRLALARRIGSTEESISRWERADRPMEPWFPLALLALLRERLMPRPPDVELDAR